jgi:hypothetical protein
MQMLTKGKNVFKNVKKGQILWIRNFSTVTAKCRQRPIWIIPTSTWTLTQQMMSVFAFLCF